MVTQGNTLSDFAGMIRQKYSHVSDLAALRDQAIERVRSMLETLQIARQHSNLTQTAVAKKLGVSQATISRWESGEEEISLRDFVFFMQACNEKMALVAAPGDARFSDEEMARGVVTKLIEQLYPELNLTEVFPEPVVHVKRKKPTIKEVSATKELRMSRKTRLNISAVRQAKAAVRTATSSFNNLGVALETFEDATE